MNLFTLFGTIAIDSKVAENTINSTMEQVNGLKTSLEGAEQQSKSTGNTFKTGGSLHAGSVFLGNVYTKIGSSVINMMKTFTKTGFQFDASMEAYQNQFEALLGDAAKASQLVADLQLLAKVSPLGMEGLANNAVSLLNTGTELESIIPTLEMLGNLALGDTQKMDGVVRAYTQILGKGALMAQEMYQLSDQGVPIIEIMTKYGGERYEDGSWYQEKMSNPKYQIPAEDMVNAFQLATAEGGKWHDYMFQMMDTWNGQVDRMGEEGKESLGAFFNPFFEVAKSDVLPRLSESLAGFGTWVSENQDVISKMADTIGKLVTGGFDAMINAFTWMAENGEMVKAGLAAIAVGLVAGAVAAHPYAAAITAVVAGLAMLKTGSEGLATGANYDKMFNKFSDADLQTLQTYVDAVNAAREAEEAYANSNFDDEAGAVWEDALAKQQEAFNAANAVDGLISTYNSWRSGQAVNQGKDLYLDVPLRVKDGAEGEIQSELSGMSLEAVVHMLPDTSQLSQIAGFASGIYGETNWNADGAIFSKPTIFNTRMGLQGVGEAGAEAVAPLDKLQQYVSDAVRSTVGGMQFNVVLDSGVLVGQLAPQFDTKLGTISSRKGRRN